MSRVDYTTFAGDSGVDAAARVPFDPLACAFLGDLSAALRDDMTAKAQPDVMTFAFWCRNGNIEKLKARYAGLEKRLGRGVAFHIAPSNVPINFAYSFAFALLAGNTNIVRLPSRDLPQIEAVCKAINKLLLTDLYAELRNCMSFIRYPQDNTITSHFSATCDVRIIWGGDTTVNEIRKLPIAPRTVDLVFPDRYSFCVLAPETVLAASDEQISKLADGFFNDTYLMDQNACSSPHLVVWLDADKVKVAKAKQKFWDALHKVVRQRYALASVQAVDKYTQLLQEAIHYTNGAVYTQYGNDIYTISLNDLPQSLEAKRGKFGLFYEYQSPMLEPLAPYITNKFQTLTYYGLDKNALQDFVLKHHLRGIDRIVPIGQALDIDIMWDGIDIIRHLSRVIDVR